VSEVAIGALISIVCFGEAALFFIVTPLMSRLRRLSVLGVRDCHNHFVTCGLYPLAAHYPSLDEEAQSNVRNVVRVIDPYQHNTEVQTMRSIIGGGGVPGLEVGGGGQPVLAIGGGGTPSMGGGGQPTLGGGGQPIFL
jgi:hypothetical protein